MSGHRARPFNHDLDKTGAIPMRRILARINGKPDEPAAPKRRPMDPRVSGALAIVFAVVATVTVAAVILLVVAP